MARYGFGTSVADYVIDSGASGELLVGANVQVYFYNAPTGGTQYTDLVYDPEDITTIEYVTSDAKGGIPLVYGPDGVLFMWADASGGIHPRKLMITRDIGSVAGTLQTDLAAAQANIASLQASIAGLAAVASSGAYGDLVGAPALATVATSGSYTDLINTPPAGLQYIQKVGGSWPVRASTAPDTARVAAWIGPAPAPAFGGGYAEAGDLWLETPA